MKTRGQAHQCGAAAIFVRQGTRHQRSEGSAEDEGRGDDAFGNGRQAEAAACHRYAHEGQGARYDTGVVTECQRTHRGGDGDLENEAAFFGVGWGWRGNGRCLL
jgi:hypothetical protein